MGADPMNMKLSTALATGLGLAAPALAADVVVGVPNWPSVTVTAHVIKEIVEKNMGLTVELQTGTNPVIFEGMDKGAMQVHPEVWLPNQQSLVDQYAAKVELNTHPTSAVQGVCVNQAALDAGIKDITDLTDPAKAALMDSDGNGKGELYIGATGWASTTVEKAKAHGYGYDQVLDLVELDESVAYAQLDTAITAAKPWAGFCYQPHHLFTVHPEMAFLTEPAFDAAGWSMIQPDADPDWLAKSTVAMAWPPAFIQPAFARGMDTSSPQVAALLRAMDVSADELGAFSYAVVIDGKDPAQVAADWIAANPDRVTAWLK
jgi:glycine betaine/proline transport system substrate-binding protein